MINTDGRPTIACGVTRREQYLDLVRDAADGDPGEQDEAEVLDDQLADVRFRPVTVHVDRLIAYEQGDLSSDEALQLIADLVRSGQVWHLQGSYGRFAAQLIIAGRINERGDICTSDDPHNHQGDTCPVHESEDIPGGIVYRLQCGATAKGLVDFYTEAQLRDALQWRRRQLTDVQAGTLYDAIQTHAHNRRWGVRD